MNKSFLFVKQSVFASAVIFIFLFSFVHTVLANKTETIAVVPFDINSPDDISHIKEGVVSMLHSRLYWQDKVSVVKQGIINKNLQGYKSGNRNELIKHIADATGSDYVLTGTITQFAGSFSLDTQLVDIKNNRQLTFFEQAKQIDNVIPKLDRIAGKINKEVFDRTTVAWDEYQKEINRPQEDMQRMSPEMMMPFPNAEREEKIPVWKFWKYMW